ncbi:MAG: TRAM domain-containing protein [Candidatus Micrarchaeota archaeon]|nr:TRAM domain-containing protein [Candidatus Micrarchaeota archaeon]
MAFGRGGPDMPKPVKVGDELDVTIEAVAAKGDGIAKKDGFVIFVPGTAVGDKCRIRINTVKPSCAVAEKIEGAPSASEEQPSA